MTNENTVIMQTLDAMHLTPNTRSSCWGFGEARAVKRYLGARGQISIRGSLQHF